MPPSPVKVEIELEVQEASDPGRLARHGVRASGSDVHGSEFVRAFTFVQALFLRV